MNKGNSPPTQDDRKDPFASYRYRVEIDGKEAGGFSEVSGLSIETEIESFREGGVNTHVLELAGPAKFPAKLILKRGLASSTYLWDWYRKIMAGTIDRRLVTVILLDYAGDAKWRWVFQKACPVKWVGPQLRATATEVAFESIELIHQGIKPDDPSGLK